MQMYLVDSSGTRGSQPFAWSYASFVSCCRPRRQCSRRGRARVGFRVIGGNDVVPKGRYRSYDDDDQCTSPSSSWSWVVLLRIIIKVVWVRGSLFVVGAMTVPLALYLQNLSCSWPRMILKAIGDVLAAVYVLLNPSKSVVMGGNDPAGHHGHGSPSCLCNYDCSRNHRLGKLF
ncbi:hypothetical protein BAE44_0016766 [Dichanthelium oligosanthes]|uniref:Uncharacterized protein n=1 Tax=Dichanthelium oligosanthes TaxID=888268 RepID=A0A1E5VAN8_9POAL|nr:hypothetical protein BAE44_0016766 [Dichanthelium oligosanthes]